MVEREITLYHGTSAEIADMSEDIYGMSNRGEFSGNLTNSLEEAARFARVKSIYPDKARVIEFRLPQSIVVDHGPIPGIPEGPHGYSTTQTVRFDDLPKEFMRQLSYPIRELARLGKISFFRVGSEFRVQTIELTG